MAQKSPVYAELDLPPRKGPARPREDAVAYAQLAFPTDKHTSAAESLLEGQPCPVQRDLKFDSMNVMLLREYNFDSFISTKEKVLVYFYSTNKPQDPALEVQFSDVSSLSIIYLIITRTMSVLCCMCIDEPVDEQSRPMLQFLPCPSVL